MSTAVAVRNASLPQTTSLGQFKMQVFDVTMISGDTVVTVTADRMSTVLFAILSNGTKQTAAPTYATNVATFTITDPAATAYGQAIVFGV